MQDSAAIHSSRSLADALDVFVCVICILSKDDNDEKHVDGLPNG